MARMIVQTKVITAREKELNHFLSTLDMDNFIGVQYQEDSGTFSALVLYRIKRS